MTNTPPADTVERPTMTHRVLSGSPSIFWDFTSQADAEAWQKAITKHDASAATWTIKELP